MTSNSSINIVFANFENSQDDGERITVAVGTTVQDILRIKLRNYDASRYSVRLNREPAELADVLENGDRLSITPTKINGAR